MHMIGRNTITKPKNEEGIGLQKASIKNNVALYSLAWRIKRNSNSTWASILTNKFNHTTYMFGKNCSRAWKAIHRAWNLCRDTSSGLFTQGGNVDLC